MTKSKTTRRALLSSCVALMLCFSMLLGTTYAWFTDSVTSANNIIVAGNLDVELYYLNDEVSDWTKVTTDTNVFKKDTLWEPGHTEVVQLKVVNEGTLALKYLLDVNVASETGSVNVDNKPFKLSDYIKFGIVDGEKSYTRDEAVAAVEDNATKLNVPFASAVKPLATKTEEIVTLVVYMPTSVDNEANYKTGATVPTINLGINLFATQVEAESDSFGPDYDAGAGWTGSIETDWHNDTAIEFTLTTAEELAGLAKIVNDGIDDFAGKTVKLGADIDLRNVNWTPIGVDSNKFVGTFIGTGYTISNLRVVGEEALGLFGKTFTGAHIEGVTIDKAYVSGSDYVGAILGQGYLGYNCIKNCTVINATIIAAPFQQDDGTYDGGAKAGVIAGQAYNGNITGCVVKESTVTAYRDLGGIAGMLDFDGKAGTTVEASGNTVENVTLNYVGAPGTYGDGKPNQNMGEVIGRVGANAVVGTNTINNVTMNEANKGTTMISTLEELIDFAEDVNNGNTYAGKTVMLGDDIDLLNMEWTPIGTGDGFKGIFDGNGKTISNLKITGNNSTVGLFANTYNGEIKNLTVENADVSGYLNVGVVAGNPYTSKYTNITVTGHVEVNGFSYVGGVGGKNAYANWTDITVNVDETSYVNANSVENGTAYRTYVGGVVGFNGEGGHTFKNITSNIDVTGNVCDIGGVFGIAHYQNKFENITCSGDVTTLVSSEIDGDDAATDALETGLIAGVWYNKYDMTFNNVSATGTISAPNVEGVNFVNNGLIGKAYSATETGKLTINGVYLISNLSELQTALDNATGISTITLGANITGNVTATQKPDVKVTIEGNKYTFAGTITVDGKSARYETAALTIQNVNFDSETSNGVAYINLGNGNDSTRYTNNVTVQNCTFKGYGDDTVDGAVAVKSYTGGDWNLTLDNLTVDNGIHSMLQVTNVEKGLKITDCKVYSKNGINLNNTLALEMSGCEFDVRGYAVRFGVSGNTTNGTFSIANSTLKSVCNDGDSVIIFRGTMTGSTLTLTGTTLVGSSEIAGTANVVKS